MGYNLLPADPCPSWPNKYNIKQPPSLERLDLDLHESWVHLLTEGVLSSQHRSSQCEATMAWLALTLGFINVAAQDRSGAFEYFHMGQGLLVRAAKEMDVFAKAGRSSKAAGSLKPEEQVFPPSEQEEQTTNPVKTTAPFRPANSGSIGGEEPTLLYQDNTVMDRELVAEENVQSILDADINIYERQISFPVHVHLPRFFVFARKFFDLMAKLDLVQGLALQVANDVGPNFFRGEVVGSGDGIGLSGDEGEQVVGSGGRRG